jgi:Mg2+-importing ATPase
LPSAAPEKYWTVPASRLLSDLDASTSGLSTREAEIRQARVGPNSLEERRRLSVFGHILNQLRSPLVLLLAGAAGVSLVVAEWLDASIILAIVAASVAIGFWREFDAGRAMEGLLNRLTLRAHVLRDGTAVWLPAAEIVPGDVVLLGAGSLVPADAILLEATDFFAGQAILTGESLPVEKAPGEVKAESSLAERTNCVFMGTSVRSGTGRALIIHTGASTIYGGIAGSLKLRPPETEFERGLRHFGYLLMTVALLLVIFALAVNVYFSRPVIQSLLFAIALAVGLSPELLPAILSVNLSRSARDMAKHGVLVRRLNAIENLGSMDVLCSDKTGTLTEGDVRLHGAFDREGAPSEEVLDLAAVNAALDTGLSNLLDDAILKVRKPDAAGVEKLDEIPYDFLRKRVSVVVRQGGRIRLITKGALEPLLTVVSSASVDEARLKAIRDRFAAWSAEGYRVLGVAFRDLPARAAYTKDDERELQFAGFLVFHDPPKAGVEKTVAELVRSGVRLKIITGDAALVARHVAEAVGLVKPRMLTGKELDELRDEALWQAAELTDIFAEVDPNQKERIILALKKKGHVVGYLGDGINDAPALHAADVGISVDQAADVAKEAADIVILEPSLDALRRGIEQGRTTFANTLKYILTTTSANFGNMISMAAASIFVPFFPLLPVQILLNNFLSDIPAFAMGSDRVDPELISRPRRWNMGLIRRFMIEFGLLSSLFDFMTFGVLRLGFHSTPELFRSGWFVESLLTELLVALVVRTRRPLWKSPPGRALLASTAAVMALAFAVPYVPHAWTLGFVPIPAGVLLSLVGITAAYVMSAEALKRRLYGRET